MDWAMGWVVVGLHTVTVIAQFVILMPRNPDLLAERTGVQKGSQRMDTVLAALAGSFLPLAGWIVAGLDIRFGWSPQMPPAVQIGAAVFFLLGWALLIWAMASNPFFSLIVRIQEDRGHTVASGGPYRYVRHPGYVGAILFQLALPFIFGSFWAFIPMGLSAPVYIVRTALEDKTLQDELDGYAEYARWVRHRLLPGLW
jgi:protein-S-isoprenylcysteine O-methyltransferase Ste14